MTATAPQNREILYGRNPVHEALRAWRRRVYRIWVTEAAGTEPWLAGIETEVETVDGHRIERIAETESHQGICAEVDPYPYSGAAELLAAERPLIVALDQVQDPQNLGAIARSAECAGATGLVIPRHRSAEVTSAVAKASAGAVEHLRIARVRNIADFLAEAGDAGCWSYGAAASGTPYKEIDFSGGVVLVMGAEGSGLRPRVQETCDQLVSIPLRGQIDSLNVSAAAAVLLYAITG